MAGGVLSTTVTVNEQLDPPEAEHVTVVVPTAKTVPGGGVQVTEQEAADGTG
jgi:hypothetical protein